MKRILLIVLVLAVMFLAAAFANAGTYTVVKGDYLSKIAVRYQVKVKDLHQANKQIIKNPDRIYPGQKLTIPVKGKIAQTETSSVKKINKLGTKPFVGDPAWALKALGGYSDSDIAELVEKIKSSQQYDWGYLENGDKVAMVFGKKGFYPLAEMDFPEGHLEAVKIYHATSGKEVWLPLACNNPTKLLIPHVKIREAVQLDEEQKPPVEKPLEVVILPPVKATRPPEPTPPPEAKKQLMMLLIPPPVVVETKVVQQEIPEEKCYNCQPDIDISVGAFADRHQSGNNPHGVWVVGNFFLCGIKDGDKTHSFGIALEGNLWEGVTSDEYHYFGRRYAVDAAYRLLAPNTEFQARVGLGKVDDWGHITPNSDGRYESDQTSTIITAYTGYEKSRTDTNWFTRMRYYASVDFDISRDKSDQWVDTNTGTWPQNGEPSNKTMYNLGVDGSIYKLTENVSLAGGASLTHYQEGSMTGARISPGLDFYGNGTLIGNARVNPTYWSTSDHAIGLSVMADLSNIFKYLRKKFASPPESIEKEN